VSEAVYESVRDAHPDAVRRVLNVKGREEPVTAYALGTPKTVR
jgi:class 3 adenylate cyclase